MATGPAEVRSPLYGKMTAVVSAAAVFVLAVVLSVAVLWSSGDGRGRAVVDVDAPVRDATALGDGLDMSTLLGTPVRRMPSAEGLAVKVFMERAVEALNVQRAECGHGLAPFVYQPTDIFVAWERAEPHRGGEIVAAAARVGTSRIYGVSENHDGASKPLAFSLFELGDESQSGAAAPIDVCTVAVSMGGRTQLNDKSGATDAMIYYVSQLNAICGFEPAIASGRIRSARVRVVAGRIWSLNLRVAGQNIDDAEVLQDLTQSYNLTRASRAEVENRWCALIRESRVAFANVSRSADDRPKSHSGQHDPTKSGDTPDFNELSPAELEQLGGGLFAELQPVGKFGELEIPQDATEGTSTSYDLREEFSQCVNPSRVQYQGQCGSCWSFAVHTAWANQVCIRGDAVSPDWTLSKQYQLTCNSKAEYTDPTSTGSSTGLDPNAPQSACEGGTLSEAWKWSMVKGAVPEQEIPYAQSLNTKNVDDTQCDRVVPTEKTKCRSRRRLRTDEQIMYAIEKFKTPVTVGMMTYDSFYDDDWWGTVYQPTKTEVSSGERGGHAVQIIGWGVDTGGVSSDGLENPPYWIIENSWGSDWGETVSNTPTSRGARAGGYFRHIRGDLVRNVGTGCEGAAGGIDGGCVASSSFTDGGTDEATGQPKQTVFQNTFLIDGYFAEACEEESGTGRRCASAGRCREVKVLGGDAGTLISSEENPNICVQEFQFRTSQQAEGMLVAEGPADIDPAGGFNFGSPGVVHEFKLDRRARVHNFEISVPTAPGLYSLSFYPMDGDTAIGDPFTFDYPINCNNLQRPAVVESSLILFFVLGALAAAVVAILLICHHFRSAAHQARQTGKVKVNVRRADGTVETYERKMVTKKDREARRKAREKQREKKRKAEAKRRAKGHKK